MQYLFLKAFFPVLASSLLSTPVSFSSKCNSGFLDHEIYNSRKKQHAKWSMFLSEISLFGSRSDTHINSFAADVGNSSYSPSLALPLPRRHTPANSENKRNKQDKTLVPLGNTPESRAPRMQNPSENFEFLDNPSPPLSIPKNIPSLSDVLSGKLDKNVGSPSRDRQTIHIPSKNSKKSHRNIVSAEQTDDTITKAKSKAQKYVHDNQEERSNPWQARYYTSMKTQQKIKRAAAPASTKLTDANTEPLPPQIRASNVLQALLTTTPERCNVANLVCALTMSAKLMVASNRQKKKQFKHRHGGTIDLSVREKGEDQLFRDLFYQTTDILSQIIQQNDVNNATSLTSRQLCNVIWAIAKHCDQNPTLLPQKEMHTTTPTTNFLPGTSKGFIIGKAEKLDLRLDQKDNPAHRLDETIDAIAIQLYRQIVSTPDAGETFKEGELCMASWAFGILRPRTRPPGWKHGLRSSELPPEFVTSSENRFRNSNPDLVKFESWSDINHNDQDGQRDYDTSNDLEPTCPTNALFDAIAFALTRHGKNQGLPLSAGSSEECVLIQRICLCEWSEMANVAWAFASNGRSSSAYAEKLLTTIAHEATHRLLLSTEGKGRRNRGVSRVTPDPGRSRDIAQIMWALGTLQCDNFRLTNSLIQLVDAVKLVYLGGGGEDHTSSRIRPFEHWSCADIVQTILSMAHARIEEFSLLEGLYEEAARRMQKTSMPDEKYTPTVMRKVFRTWELSILLWAQARLYLTPSHGEAFGKFLNLSVRHIATAAKSASSLNDAGIGGQEGANIAWSLTVLEENSADSAYLLSRVFNDAAVACRNSGFMHLEHAHQLWQAIFLLEDSCPGAVRNVSPWFYEYLRSRWNEEKARSKESSARHKALSQTLELMGVAHENEHEEDIDVAIVLKPNALWTHQSKQMRSNDYSARGAGLKLAVEFDGPNHFTRQLPQKDGRKTSLPRPLGHTVLKYRLLKKQGWTVVRVPYYEFDKIPFWASMERQRYLQRLLKTHGNLRFSEIDVSEYKVLTSNRRSRFD